MKKVITLVLLTFVFFAQPVFSADPLEVAPKLYKKLFENDQVRVMDLRIPAGEKVPEHSHPNHFVYPMSDAILSITKNGETKEVQTKTGEVIWINAETHSTVNSGTTEFHALVVELKEK